MAFTSECIPHKIGSPLRIKSSTTSRSGGLRKAPLRGRGYALLVAADFIEKEF
jgi:hypothetical protein